MHIPVFPAPPLQTLPFWDLMKACLSELGQDVVAVGVAMLRRRVKHLQSMLLAGLVRPEVSSSRRRPWWARESTGGDRQQCSTTSTASRAAASAYLTGELVQITVSQRKGTRVLGMHADPISTGNLLSMQRELAWMARGSARYAGST